MENNQKTIKPKTQKYHNFTRAVTDAKYATIYKGRRIVRKYKSGERLIGRIEY